MADDEVRYNGQTKRPFFKYLALKELKRILADNQEATEQ
jgi:hypothetical protein